MRLQEALPKLIVCKSTVLNENQGFVIPLLEEIESDVYKPVSRLDYPSDILITKGFPQVDERFGTTELFALTNHNFDEAKSLKDGRSRYWALSSDVENLPQNTFLPILITSLPDKQDGLLPQEVTPPESPFFILDGNKLYGPLSSTQNDDKRYIIEPHVHSLLSYGKGYLGLFNLNEIGDVVVNVANNNIEKMYISSFKAISKFKSESIDYLSDDQLIKVVNSQGFGKRSQSLGKKEAQRLQQIIAENEKTNQILKQDERVSRLKNLLDRYLSESDIGYSLIKDYLNSTSGIRFLEVYVKENMPTLLQEHLDKVKDDVEQEESRIRANLTRLEEALVGKEKILREYDDKIESKKLEVESKIAEFEAEKEDAIKKKLEEKQLKLSTEIEEAKIHLSQIEIKISEQTQLLNVANEAVQLNKRKDYL